MPGSVGTGYIDVRGNFTPFERQMSRFAVTSRSRFAKVGKGIGLGFVAGIGAAGFAAKKAFGEFQEAEKATAQTRAVLKSTGAVANVTAKEIEKLANAISVKSGIDDEAVQSSENLLLTFTSVRNQIGKGNDVFNRATSAITDMAAAMAAGGGGTPDLKGATIQVGKALQDPIKGITALRRVGVNFNQQQSDRIKGWVEEGKQLKAQKFILAELTKEFGGSAAAQATGTQKLKVAIDNLFESFGRTFGPALETAATSAANFISQMQTGAGAGGRFADRMRQAAQVVSQAWQATVGAVQKFLSDNRRDIDAFGQALENAGKAIAAVFTGFVLPVLRRILPGIRQEFQGIARALGGMINIVSGLLTGDWRQVWQGAKQVVSGTVKAIGGVIRQITAPLREVLSKVPGLFRTPFKFAEKLVADVIAGILRRFATLFDVASKLPIIGDRFKGIADSVRGLADRIDGVGEKLDTLDGKKIDIDVVMNLLTSGDTPQLQDPATNFPRRNQRRRGGMVPAMLSPGEVGITPGGGQFRVPGARVAADTVPAVVPSGTAILTTSGQRMARRGRSLGDIIRNQLPHFAKGGVANATKAGLALRNAGIRAEDSLITLLATAGRESRWDPKAKGGPNSNGTFDWGFLQANDIWANDPVIRSKHLWNRRLSFEGGAKIAKRILDAQGWSAWRLGGPGHNATIDPFWGTASAAFNASKSGGSLQRVTPAAITHPILSTQLRSLVDDALLGGVQAGIDRTGHAGRVDLLQSVLEGIVPESTDRATRERVSTGGRSGGATGAIAKRVQAGVAWAKGIAAKHMDYQYGGGHGAAGVGNPSFDCSGYSTGIAHAMGLLDSPLDTTRFASWGLPGKGKNVTFGIRGGAGMAGHMMSQVGGHFFESGGGHGPAEVSGWDGAFTTWRHPGWRKGGIVGLPPAPEGQRHLEQLAKRKHTSVPDLLDPKSRNFVGFGLRTGGTVGTARSGGYWEKIRKVRRRIRHWENRRKAIVAGGITAAEKPTLIEIQMTLTELRQYLRDLQQHPPSFPGNENEPTWARAGGFVGMQDGGWVGIGGWQGRGHGGGGGMSVGPNFDFDAWLRKFKRRHHRQPSLSELTNILGSDQLGTGNADAATRLLGRRVQGRSVGSLVRAQSQIRRKIKRMARKGFTGPERIRTRRLRGALSLLQDEMGRPIGRAIGGAQRTLDAQSGALSDFQNRQTIAGVDPESRQGLEATRQFESGQLRDLFIKRQGLDKALGRARKTPGKADDRAVQEQIRATDSAMLALGADITNLDTSIKEANDATDELKALEQQRIDLTKQQNDLIRQTQLLVQTQASAIPGIVAAMTNGFLGGNVGLGRQTPSFAGQGGLARY